MSTVWQEALEEHAQPLRALPRSLNPVNFALSREEFCVYEARSMKPEVSSTHLTFKRFALAAGLFVVAVLTALAPVGMFAAPASTASRPPCIGALR